MGCHFLLQCMKVESESDAQSCLTLSNPMDCSLPGSSVPGIFQARVLEWIAISFSRGYSRPRKHCPFLHHDPGVRRLALLRVSESIQVWFSNPNNKDSFLKTAKYVSLTFLPVLGTKVSPGPDSPVCPAGSMALTPEAWPGAGRVSQMRQS